MFTRVESSKNEIYLTRMINNVLPTIFYKTCDFFQTAEAHQTDIPLNCVNSLQFCPTVTLILPFVYMIHSYFY